MVAVLNGKQFRASLEIAGSEVPEMSLEFQKRLALEAMVRVIDRTPVDTGRARGGWQLASMTNDADNGRVDPEGIASVSQALGILEAITIAFGVIWVFNNVDYIVFLEEGSSGQAPAGMVAITLLELEAGLIASGIEARIDFSPRAQGRSRG